MTVFLVDCGSSRVPQLNQVISTLCSDVRVLVLEQAREALDLMLKSQAIIISGGPALFTDAGAEQSLMASFDFLQHSSMPPILGICLGHQALALADGGRVFRGPEIRRLESVSIDCRSMLFKGLPPKIALMEDHCEGVIPPINYQVIARSKNYEVEAMICSEKKRIGVQFHPESSGEIGVQIINNFLQYW